MALRNTTTSYGSVAKLFHWLIALLVIGMLCFGPFLPTIKDKALRTQLVMTHKLTGLTILSLMILRIVWTLNNIKPLLPLHMARWERFAARATHLMLYVLLVAMPLSGWIMSTAAGHPPSLFGLELPFPSIPTSKVLAEYLLKVHATIAITIAAFLTLHIAGALNHHFVYKDNILRRMLPGK